MKYLVIKELEDLSNKEKVEVFKRFFKTGKGDYGEGDRFLGIDVPSQRIVAKKYYKDINLKDIQDLIKSEYHEVRLTALLILTYKMKKALVKEQKNIVDLYLKNTKFINSWDLVDLSASNILGNYLFENKLSREVIYELANSDNLWNKRIAIISTLYFIRKCEYSDTLDISIILLNHKHDLIHKAVGWMLREVGKKDYKIEYDFLKKYYHQMPRTMLRYAIERFDEETRKKFLKGKI